MNQSVFLWLHALGGKNPIFDTLVLFAAVYLPYLLGVGALYLILRTYKDWQRRLAALGEILLSIIVSRGIVTECIRFFYHGLRPFVILGFDPFIPESTWSFPSGHAAFFFALAMSLFWIHRRWSISYFALTAINGLARIIAGVHWPLDVLGGALVGVGSAFLVHLALWPGKNNAPRELSRETV